MRGSLAKLLNDILDRTLRTDPLGKIPQPHTVRHQPALNRPAGIIHSRR